MIQQPTDKQIRDAYEMGFMDEIQRHEAKVLAERRVLREN
jgi:hypothetical protein